MSEETKEIKPKPPTIDDKAIAFRPKNFDEVWGFAKIVADTDFVSPADRGKPGQVLAKIQYGNELGLPAMQALRWITHINGLPSIYGDGFWMLVRAHPLTEWVSETSPEVALKQGYAEVTIQRRGDKEPTTRRFSVEEAQTAGLIERSGPKGPWTLYRGGQLVWRARHRCATAAVPEALGGLMPAEVARDYDIEIQAEKPLMQPQQKEKDNGAPRPAVAKPEPVVESEPRHEKVAERAEPPVEAKPQENPKRGRPRSIREQVENIKKAEEQPVAVTVSVADTIRAWINNCSDIEIFAEPADKHPTGERINLFLAKFNDIEGDEARMDLLRLYNDSRAARR